MTYIFFTKLQNEFIKACKVTLAKPICVERIDQATIENGGNILALLCSFNSQQNSSNVHTILYYPTCMLNNIVVVWKVKLAEKAWNFTRAKVKSVK